MRREIEKEDVGSSTAVGDEFAGQTACASPITKWVETAIERPMASRKYISERMMPNPSAPNASNRTSVEIEVVRSTELKKDKLVITGYPRRILS